MTASRFETVTIIGVGLLGGSLGLALKRRGLAARILGIGRRQSSIDSALRAGTIDEGFVSLNEEASSADLIVIATPAAQVTGFLDELRDGVRSECVVTDVASTKADICRHARDTWPKPCRFVGSHPMAGSEKWGPEHANVDLYTGAITFVEEGEHLDPGAVETVRALWETLDSRVVSVRPDEHDRLVAATSHVPHIVAAALAQALPEGDAVRAAIGPGFRDSTRVAEGRPELWRDICLTNRAEIGEALARIRSYLDTVGEALRDDDGDALTAFFEAGLQARREALGE